jgi:hypothetical protein
VIKELDDVLWQQSNGDVFAGEPGGGGAGVHLGNLEVGSIAGIGDFDGDNFDDILQRQGADVTVWLVEDGALVQRVQPDAATTFQIGGTGDFDGDGDDDIVWRHDEGSPVTIWEMEDGEYVVNHNQPNAGSFQVAGTGDFDNDGDDDILWRHPDGPVTIWEMEDGEYVVNHNQPAVDTAFQVAGVHDFDDDGDDDILWSDNQGDVDIIVWHMEDFNIAEQQTDSGPAAFQIVGVGEFDTLIA